MRDLDLDTLMFFDRHLEVLPLYRAFEELLFDSFPVVNKRVQKTQITFSNQHVFVRSCQMMGRIIGHLSDSNSEQGFPKENITDSIC